MSKKITFYVYRFASDLIKDLNCKDTVLSKAEENILIQDAIRSKSKQARKTLVNAYLKSSILTSARCYARHRLDLLDVKFNEVFEAGFIGLYRAISLLKKKPVNMPLKYFVSLMVENGALEEIIKIIKYMSLAVKDVEGMNRLAHQKKGR